MYLCGHLNFFDICRTVTERTKPSINFCFHIIRSMLEFENFLGCWYTFLDFWNIFDIYEEKVLFLLFFGEMRRRVKFWSFFSFNILRSLVQFNHFLRWFKIFFLIFICSIHLRGKINFLVIFRRIMTMSKILIIFCFDIRRSIVQFENFYGLLM